MKFKFIISFLLISASSYGQLSYDVLANLRTKNLGQIEDFLVTRNWTLSNVQEKTDTSSNQITFTRDNTETINYLEVFESRMYFLDGTVSHDYNRIMLYTTDKKLYLSLLSRIKSLNFKLEKTKIESARIKKLYKDKNTAISIISENLSEDINNPVPAYNILIAKRIDFENSLEFKEFYKDEKL